MTDEQVGAILRDARQRQGASQSEMARLGGLDQSYLSKVERGVFPIPPAMMARLDKWQLTEGERVTIDQVYAGRRRRSGRLTRETVERIVTLARREDLVEGANQVAAALGGEPEHVLVDLIWQQVTKEI